MEEISAWGEYEAGTTRNARSLGRSQHAREQGQTPKRRPPRAVVCGADKDDAATSKKTDGDGRKVGDGRDATNITICDDDIEEAISKDGDGANSERWNEMCDLAHAVFDVYFTSDDSCADSSKIKQKKMISINGTMPYLTAYLEKLCLPNWMVAVLLFTEASFRGIAQVYFMNNPLSGLLILVAMLVQSTRVAVHGTIALVAGNLAGLWMGFDKSLLSCGLFGYNSFLVGLAIATFCSPENHSGYYLPVLLCSIIFAYFSSVLFVVTGKILSPYKTPPFTLPFNVSTLFFLLAVAGMNNVEIAPVREPSLPRYETVPVSKLTVEEFFAGSLRGIGQVYLANNIFAGSLVLAGITVCSRISALAAFLGSAIGATVAALVGCDRGDIANGMHGFNPSLILVSMQMFYVPSLGSMAFGIVAASITVFVQLSMATLLAPCGLPFMTLPFCLGALSFIVIQGTTSKVISVPLESMTTPEDHLKRVQKLAQGFDVLYGAIRSSCYKGIHRRQSWLPDYKKSGTTKMTEALDDYNETVGAGTRGFFARVSGWLKGRDGQENERGTEGMRRRSFKTPFASRNQFLYEDDEKDSYLRMFRHIDSENQYKITKAQFRQFLRSIGLKDEIGLDFCSEAFLLLDLEKSGSIGVEEFIAFAKISRHMPEIRCLVIHFFDFVDINGDRSIELSELDGARAYLGLPALSDEDHGSLVSFLTEDGQLDFDVIVNFVTLFKLKSIVTEYQDKRQKGHSFDQSIHSSLSVLGRSGEL